MCLKCDNDNLPPKGNGELAQMVERSIRIREAPGSIPGFSTTVSSCISSFVLLCISLLTRICLLTSLLILVYTLWSPYCSRKYYLNITSGLWKYSKPWTKRCSHGIHMRKNKKNKKSPLRGIEPRPRRWKRRILATRPQGICSLRKMQGLY